MPKAAVTASVTERKNTSGFKAVPKYLGQDQTSEAKHTRQFWPTAKDTEVIVSAKACVCARLVSVYYCDTKLDLIDEL